MSDIIVKIKGSGSKKYPVGISLYDICNDLKLTDKVVGAKINNQINPLTTRLIKDTEVDLIDYSDLAGYKMYKAGLKFIFEVALQELYPELEVKYEHSVPKGILAEVVGNISLTERDLSKIKSIMRHIIDDDLLFEKYIVNKNEAIEYFNNHNQREKSANIKDTGEDIVTLYKLKDTLNYFYTEMPYSTKSISKFEIIYLGSNRLVFLFPSSRSKGEVPEYVHHKNIITSFLNGKKWLECMDIPYLADLNKLVSTSSVSDIIEANELLLKEQLAYVAESIVKNPEKKIVLIAGPSSSGKTTTTKRLASYMRVRGYKPITISVDDYFVDRVKTPKDSEGNYDYESLMAINVEKFNDDLNNLLEGKTIKLREYNFAKGVGEESIKETTLTDKGIILIEGLHALNDELTPKIDIKYKYKIYLSPFIPLNIDMHNYVSTIDLRILRRIIRDNRSRNVNVGETIGMWQKVREGEEKYIFPYINQADIIINTALVYEIGVIRVYAEPLLYSVEIDSPYYEEARRLITFLKRFYLIPAEDIPKDSILREFIGFI